MLNAALPILMALLAPYFYFSSQYKNNERRKEAEKTEQKDMLKESEWIFMKEGAGGAEVMILNNRGEYIGVYKSVNLPRWLRGVTVFIAWAEGFFTSTKGIFDSRDEPVAGIQKVPIKGKVTLEVNNRYGEPAGFYEEQRVNSTGKNKGVLKKPDGSVWVEVSMSSIAGDFHLVDTDGRFIASYRFGYFDYALSAQFQNSAGYELVKVNESLTLNEKTLLSAMVCYWMGYKLHGMK
ncbi:hypothetical protein [Jeotgalibacillus campisalis]|uniref:Uncharacterized protein n=1 Tax=Jeotgalibacillus campisalis TaxID=220754 RepID=A0A0C2VV72_9BACL|nr:hypothetical protein [Jeotgalibacillus campisalis]KIL52817.1 hypothetical protein KR50_01460 [Jeotgalibacillus campisalis]